MVTLLSVVASAAALIAIKQKRGSRASDSRDLKAQARLLTQAAAQRLKDEDLAGAQDIILAVLTNSQWPLSPTPVDIGVS